MLPEVVFVQANEDYTLLLEFENGEKGIFDVKPYLEKGIFKELKNIEMFKTVKVSYGTVVWDNEADFCPDTIYLISEKIF
ncbi:MAG: hypothetical protein A2086_11870 [Spirochaetes bacterium GWD1_27_9]|nr:MAG: hypothetical protein A2Z98_11510 [Spirochaetes bacterium GWB1_27_13]OHD27470.1 MAG: hypothetical protein A2Y34_16185 [Spirochaetes bacterium GWC1_27_15]OHD28663.1 MAG: hypothetical protein A2086_11870 [Spirochaetes bacterium GWD1_27_9]